MSGIGRTEDLHSIKTRALTIQNPDGSFPARGSILAVTDRIGTIAPVTDISLSSLAVESINLSGPILMNNVTAENIETNTLTLSELSIGYNLVVQDICSSNIRSLYITTNDLSCGQALVQRVFANTANVATVSNTPTMNATAAEFSRCITPSLNGTIATIRDLSSATINARTTTATRTNIYDISATRGVITNLTARSANVVAASAGDVSAGTFKTNNLRITDTISTNNLRVNGVIALNEIDLDKLIVAELQTNTIHTKDISANVATITDLSARTYSISSMNVTDKYNINTVRATTLGSTTLNATTASTTNLVATGPSTVTTLTVPTLAAQNSISITEQTNVATSITANSRINAYTSVDLSGGILTCTAPNTLFVNGLSTTNPLAFSQQTFYDVSMSSGLATVSDISSTLNTLVTSYNSLLGIFNGRGLIVSIAPLFTFNSPVSLQIKTFGVWRTPLVFPPGNYDLATLLGPPFDINYSTLYDASGNPTIPDPSGNGTYWRGLNGYTPYMQFSAKSVVGVGWQVTIRFRTINDPPVPIVAINDISGSTQSLQMMRYLGFDINDATNPFQQYVLNSETGSYGNTSRSLAGFFTSTIPLSLKTDIPNTLTPPSFTVTSSTANSVSFKLTNPQGKYFFMNVSGTSVLFPSVNNVQTVYNLAPSTTYQSTGIYLDNYNTGGRTATSVALTTVPLLPPTNLAATATFKSITLTWTAPFPGRTYSYVITATGANVPASTTVVGTSATFTNLVQNTAYNFTIYTLDTVFNVRSTGTASLVYSTPTVASRVPLPDISTNSPFATTRPPNNLSAIISWSQIPADISATLYYDISSAPQVAYPIRGGTTSLTVQTPSKTGNIAAYLKYTDLSNNTNTGTGQIKTVVYDSSFGFYDRPSSGTTDISSGVGYLFTTISNTNPWIGNTISAITFPSSISGTAQITANVYNITPSVYAAIDISSSQISPFNLATYGKLIATSNTGTPSTTLTLTFGTPVTITASTVVLIQRGPGTASFPVYATGGMDAYATAVRYTSSGLFNDFLKTGTGLICQFR